MEKSIVTKPVRLFWITLVLLMPMFGACQKESETEEDVLLEGELLDFQLVVYDENGVKTNSIKEGVDFSIYLERINRTDETMYVPSAVYRELLTQLHPQKEFLAVYKGSSTKGVFVGKPYDTSAEPIFPDINWPPREVPPNGVMNRAGYPWSSNIQNQPLAKGNYISSFRGNVTVDGTRGHIDTEIIFEVK